MRDYAAAREWVRNSLCDYGWRVFIHPSNMMRTHYVLNASCPVLREYVVMAETETH